MQFSFSGGGHGGRGGQGAISTTGAAYGHLFEPDSRGCRGGAQTTGTHGKGGGVISMLVHERMKVDGEISCNGGHGSSGSGGGSGGSVLIQTGMMHVCILVVQDV